MIAILFKYYFVICLFQTFPPRSPSYSPFYLLIICRPKLCRGSSGPWWAASWRRTPCFSPSGRFWTHSKSEDLYLVLYSKLDFPDKSRHLTLRYLTTWTRMWSTSLRSGSADPTTTTCGLVSRDHLTTDC